MGKAPHRQHRVHRKEDIVSENTIPNIHFDYLYFNEEDERELRTTRAYLCMGEEDKPICTKQPNKTWSTGQVA